jgi:hypothetical protein
MFYVADCINRLNCHDISFMNIKLSTHKFMPIHAPAHPSHKWITVEMRMWKMDFSSFRNYD